MAVPKRKTSKSKRNMRRSHHALKPTYGVECQNCGAHTRAHHVCSSCGFYKGRQVIENKADTELDDTEE